MKPVIRLFGIITFFIFLENLYAQDVTALPFLYFNPSPKLNGMGLSGTSLPTNDPAGFYYNPAQLGYIGQNNTVSLQIYPSEVNFNGYLPGDGIKYVNTGFNLGYNFNKLLNGLNLSAGFGYIHSKLDYGNLYAYGPDLYNLFDAYGFGVGIDYLIKLNIGVTYKKVSSLYPTGGIEIPVPLKTDISAFDFGFLLTVPVLKIINSGIKYKLPCQISSFPYLNISLGYSKLNVGKEVDYHVADGPLPLPRTARLGYSISPGFNIILNNSIIKALGYDFTVDADDYLAEYNPTANTYSYQNFLGDINAGRNLFGLKSDNNVVIHVGHNINMLETVSFQIGRFDGRYYHDEQTSGIGITAKGVLTILKAFTKNTTFSFIADHLDVQYYKSYLFKNDPAETKFESINLVWSGMDL